MFYIIIMFYYIIFIIIFYIIYIINHLQQKHKFIAIIKQTWIVTKLKSVPFCSLEEGRSDCFCPEIFNLSILFIGKRIPICTSLRKTENL